MAKKKSKNKTPVLSRVDNTQVATLVKIFSGSKYRNRSSGVLKCLVDADAHKWAQKMYFTYISDTDFSKFPMFLTKLDRLLYKFGGKVADKPSEDEDEDLISRPKKKKERREEMMDN